MRAHDSAPAPERGRTLIAVARDAIARELGLAPVPWSGAAWLEEDGAAFVTLRARGRLRGCIGSLEARRPLGVDVRDNARAAAFADERFPPLVAAEWVTTVVEISELGPARELDCRTEDDLLAAIVPGEDGLIVQRGGLRATFLPQVWRDLPVAADFVRQLKLKAGFAREPWDDECRAWRYRVVKWTEEMERT